MNVQPNKQALYP